MIELLTSDPVILLCSAIGLLFTGWSIVRDTRTQREREVDEEVIELPRAA